MEGDECLASTMDKAALLPIGQNVGWAPDSVRILWISLPPPEAKLRFLGGHIHRLNTALPDLFRSSVADCEIMNFSYRGANLWL
jgi:hypothetical protein